ncbi:MAG: Uma2 family endonuclease [Methylococcaceae bacterium]|nr:Uma2 family endonuclease [Methylococcaceae bacterium]
MQMVTADVFTAEDYLAWEELQEEKHEYVGAEVFAMGGVRREHVVAGNVFAALKQRLRGTPCQVYISDMKLRVEQVDAFFYPDVMVSCDKQDQQAEQFLTVPSLIIEVLSDSTEAYDRGAKFAAYRQIDSLKEYVLIDIKARRVECFRRTAENDWLLHICEAAVCDLYAVETSIALSEIFEGLADSQQ